MQNIHKVFVYGSLKKTFAANNLLESHKADFIGNKITKNKSYKMVSLGSFPGVLKTNNKYKIAGELYAVNDDCLSSLDRLEGHPHFYKREPVVLATGEKAWMYLLQSEWSHFKSDDLSESIENKSGTLNWKGPQTRYSWSSFSSY
jgi:gamma-glutamylaminecyclotransferase